MMGEWKTTMSDSVVPIITRCVC